MSKLMYGSLNFTAIAKAAKAGHSAFKKAENGNIYFNIKQWLNDEKDAKGNDSSILLYSKKEKAEAEGKIYIGNMKHSEAKETPVSAADLTFGDNEVDLDNLPF